MQSPVSSGKSLSFDPQALTISDFNPQAFIAALRPHAPLSVVRDDLRTHVAHLQSQIVTALQNDFHVFSTLSAPTAEVPAMADAIATPLHTLRSTLNTLLTSLDHQVATLDRTLLERRTINNRRAALETLIHAHQLLTKCERLLKQYASLPSATSQDALRLAERIADEAAHLTFVLRRATPGAFLNSLSVRIAGVRRSVRACLDAWLRRSLRPVDTTILSRVLTMYVVAGIGDDAEAFFRREIVAPFASSRLRISTMLAVAEQKKGPPVTPADALDAAEQEIVNFLGESVMPIVSLVESEDRLRSRLDFVGRSVWPQIERAISTHMLATFSPGIPDVFHQSVLAGARIYVAIDAAVGNDAMKEKLRMSKTTTAFWKHWNLPVYFQLRFQEITSRFDRHLTEGPVPLASSPLANDDWAGSTSRLLRTDVYHAVPTASLVASLRRCWSEAVFLDSLTHRFLRLSLQLLARYSTWVRTGLAGEWNNVEAVPKGAARVFYDITVLQKRIPAELSSVLRLRASSLPSDILDRLDSAFADAVDAYSSLLPDLSRSISDALARTCIENLQPLRGILATYRMSSKQAPSTHSSFVPKILRPLKVFLKDHESVLEASERVKIATSIVEQTTAEYYNMATDLLQRNKSSEATLRRLNIGRSSAFPGAGSNASNVIEKISTQLYLDVEKFSDEIKSLGVAMEDVSSISRLRDTVKREEKAHDEKKDDGSVLAVTPVATVVAQVSNGDTCNVEKPNVEIETYSVQENVLLDQDAEKIETNEVVLPSHDET